MMYNDQKTQELHPKYLERKANKYFMEEVLGRRKNLSKYGVL